MKSSLLIGDFIIVNKSSYGYSRYSFPLGLAPIEGRIQFTPPKRGDVIVFRPPGAPATDYIKRLVGLPGDTVRVRNGVVYLNGKALKRQPVAPFEQKPIAGSTEKSLTHYIETIPRKDGTTLSYYTLDETPYGKLDNTELFTIPEGHYFFMGDNRDNSADSRTALVGYVPAVNLVGRADTIFFSIRTSIWKIWEWAGNIRTDRFWEDVLSAPSATDIPID